MVYCRVGLNNLTLNMRLSVCGHISVWRTRVRFAVRIKSSSKLPFVWMTLANASLQQPDFQLSNISNQLKVEKTCSLGIKLGLQTKPCTWGPWVRALTFPCMLFVFVILPFLMPVLQLSLLPQWNLNQFKTEQIVFWWSYPPLGFYYQWKRHHHSLHRAGFFDRSSLRTQVTQAPFEVMPGRCRKKPDQN